MKELRRIGLKNIIYFKKASLSFRPGLTFILGRNKNAGGKKASNAAGKSSLFFPVYSAFGFSNPIVKGKNVLRTVYGKSSVSMLEFKSGKHVWRIEKGKSKIKLFRDGTDIKIRTSTLAQQKIDHLLDTTEDEFYSIYYIDSSRPHLFQNGTSAERFAFITRMFRLTDIDEIRRKIKSEISDMNAEISAKERLKEELDQLVADFDGNDIADLNTQYDELVERQKLLVKKQVKLERQVHVLDVARSFAKQYKKLKALEEDLGLGKADITKAIKKTNKLLRQFEESSEQLGAYKAYRKKWKELQAKREALPSDGITSVEELKKKIRRIEDELRKYSDMEKPTRPDSPGVSEGTLAKLKKYGIPLDASGKEKLAKALGKYSSLHRSAKEQLEEFDRHLSDQDVTNCPTCHSSLSKRTKETLREALVDKAKDAYSKYDAVKALQSVYSSAMEWARYDKDLGDYQKARRRRNEILAEHDMEAMRSLLKVLVALEELEEVEKPDVPDIDPDALRDRYSKLKELAAISQAITGVQSMIDEAKEIKGDNTLAETLDELQIKKQQIADSLTKLNTKIPALRSKIDLLKSKSERHSLVVSQIGEIDAKITDLPIYKALLEAYSAGGLKLLLIRRLTSMLETNLNKFAQVLFRENFRFQLEADERNFIAIVNRKHSGREVSSDIKHLSGAERRIFILLFLLALLPLIPHQRRFDTLILDEPDVNLDPDMFEIFRDRLLPMLNKIVPKVVVISPNPAVVPTDGKVNVFTVVKQGSESQVLEGYHE